MGIDAAESNIHDVDTDRYPEKCLAADNRENPRPEAGFGFVGFFRNGGYDGE